MSILDSRKNIKLWKKTKNDVAKLYFGKDYRFLSNSEKKTMHVTACITYKRTK